MPEIVVYSASAWQGVAEEAHRTVFGEDRPSDLNRIDYALVAKDDRGFLGYITCREHDAETVYWQFGGAHPDDRSSVRAVRAYEAAIIWARDRYRRVHTLVEAENVRYLKLAMSQGFRVVGTRNFKGKVLVELLLEFPIYVNQEAKRWQAS